MKKITLLRITTVPHSLDLLLKGQLKYMSENQVEVFCASAKGPETSCLELREGVKHYNIPLTRTLNPLKDLIALLHTIQLIWRLKPDIVHSHSPKAGIIGMLAAALCRTRLRVHTVAGLPLVEAEGLKKWILLYVEKVTYHLAHYVLPNSKVQSQYIIDNIISEKKKKKVVVLGSGSSNGIDLNYFDRTDYVMEQSEVIRNTYAIKTTEIVISFVGRLANYKGINELTQAFKTLQGEYPDLRLLLIGPLEWLNPLSNETLKELESNPKIVMTGHQDDIRPFLALSDIFVFPSYREGFPQSLMQAIAFNLPCVASDINGCNEMIVDGRTGYLVPPKDHQAIVDRCRILIENAELRKKMGVGGRIYLKNHFDQSFVWKTILDFYRSALKLS